MDDGTIEPLLAAETVAIVGASSTPGKAAHDVPAYLLEAGFDVQPVNPHAESVLGRPAADDIRDVEKRQDLVTVFRPSEEAGGIVEAVLERPDEPNLWFQQGIRNDEAADRARDAGRTVVQDRCMRTEHRRRAGQSS